MPSTADALHSQCPPRPGASADSRQSQACRSIHPSCTLSHKHWKGLPFPGSSRGLSSPVTLSKPDPPPSKTYSVLQTSSVSHPGWPCTQDPSAQPRMPRYVLGSAQPDGHLSLPPPSFTKEDSSFQFRKSKEMWQGDTSVFGATWNPRERNLGLGQRGIR